MQEWWVSLRRNDGSTWVGIYTRNTNGTNFTVKQQVVDLHQAEDLLVINDITFIFVEETESE